jgi:hypothetical protein
MLRAKLVGLHASFSLSLNGMAAVASLVSGLAESGFGLSLEGYASRRDSKASIKRRTAQAGPAHAGPGFRPTYRGCFPGQKTFRELVLPFRRDFISLASSLRP